MAEIKDREELFGRKQRLYAWKREEDGTQDSFMSAQLVTFPLPKKAPEAAAPHLDEPHVHQGRSLVSDPVEPARFVPALDPEDRRRLAINNLQFQNFKLEQAIAVLKKESDGGARSTGLFIEIQKSIEACLAVLSK